MKQACGVEGKTLRKERGFFNEWGEEKRGRDNKKNSLPTKNVKKGGF